MTDLQRNEESADDVREGTATYAQLRALEIIKSGGFTPGLTNAEDPYYRGFAEADRIIESYAERLAKSAAKHEDPKMKCYDYGSFQCALAERLVPGWQQQVEQGKPMDAVLASAIPVADAERADIERRLRGDYPYEDVRRGATAFTQARDAAYQTISSRQGRVYIVDLKPVRQYMDGLAGKAGAYRLGLLTLFPAGYPGFTLDAVVMSPVKVPCNTDQLFYFRAVDTESRSRKQALTVSGQRQADGTYVDAVVTTPLFTLKAPKVRIVETGEPREDTGAGAGEVAARGRYRRSPAGRGSSAPLKFMLTAASEAPAGVVGCASTTVAVRMRAAANAVVRFIGPPRTVRCCFQRGMRSWSEKGLTPAARGRRRESSGVA